MKMSSDAGGGGVRDGPEMCSITRVMMRPEMNEEGIEVAGVAEGGRCELIQDRRRPSST